LGSWLIEKVLGSGQLFLVYIPSRGVFSTLLATKRGMISKIKE
jgi:hypothetical protein